LGYLQPLTQSEFGQYFAGYYDPTGILSVSTVGLGNGAGSFFNYSLDNVTVGAVPIPATVWVFGSGLIGLIGLVIRKT